jgi:4-diphosphocytidyl-2-C-methyl-D-erythritol kinase
VIQERAYAKLNLVLHVGAARQDGLHPICSLFASLRLGDDVAVEPAERDAVSCAAVEGENLASRAIAAIREAVPRELPPLAVRIEKQIPVAAGLGGASADAAAVLRAANQLVGRPLDGERLKALAAVLGADVPSQVDPLHALVTGAGERVEPVRLPRMALVLVPQAEGLRTADVYAELDRLGRGRASLDPEPLRRLARAPLHELAAGVENDLQAAALSLRPELEGTLAALRKAGALATAMSGSGPTAFGIFADREAAMRAAGGIGGAMVTETRDVR